MTDATVNSTVGVNLSPEGMVKAAKRVLNEIRKIAGEIDKAGNATAQQLQRMSQELKKVQTLQSAGVAAGRNRVADLGNFQNIGRQARALAEYRQGYMKTADAVGVLRGRIQQLDIANGKLVNDTGRLPNQKSLLNIQNLERTAGAYGKLTNQVGALRGRVAALGDDSRKALNPLLNNLDKLNEKNQKAFGKDNRFGFDRQIEAFDKQVKAATQQVRLAEKTEKFDSARLANLRQQGQQILNNTRIEKEARLASSVRAAQSRQNNADLIGASPSYERETNQKNRLYRATTSLVAAQNQLNTALSSPASTQNAARLQTLINRERELLRLQGEAIAKQNQLNTARKGGFVGGLKASAGNLFGDEGGGAYGAGALVGRVGAYALAAGAVYGLMTAMRDAITFTIQFEDQLAQLQAISGSTNQEMERLSSSIIKVSQSSVNSVLELTKSATIIAQAGYVGAEIETLLKNTVNLAGASGSTTDESVDILTSALGAFQLTAAESTQVADGLVAVLNKSKLSVNQVQLALQYLGNTAAQQNITLNELLGTVGSMADAGIRSGSIIATGTRQMLIDFIDPSKKLIDQLTQIGLTTADIDVKVLGLTEVLTRLRDAGFQAYGALETRAAAAYAAQSANIENTERLTAVAGMQGVAEEAQAKRLDSLSAKWNVLIATLAETGAMISGVVLPAFKFTVEFLTAMVEGLNGILRFAGATLGFFADMAAGLFGIATRGNETVQSMNDLEGILDDLDTQLNDTSGEAAALESQISSLDKESERLILREIDLTDNTRKVGVEVDSLSGRFPGLRSEFAETQQGISGLISSLFQLRRELSLTLALKAQAKLGLLGDKEAALGSKFDLQLQPFSAQARSRNLNKNRPDLAGATMGAAERALVMALESGDRSKMLTAYDGLLRNPKTQAGARSKYGPIMSTVTEMADTSYQKTIAAQNYGGARFMSTPGGSDLTNDAIRVKARADRYQSQGGDKSGLEAEIARLRGRVAKGRAAADGSPEAIGALKQINEIENLLVQAENALKPAISDSKKPGGSKKTPSNKAKKDFARSEAAIEKEELEYRKLLYENQLDILDNAPTLEDIPDIMTEVNDALMDYLKSEKDYSIAAIKKSNPTSEQQKKMEQMASLKSEQLRLDSIDKITDTLNKIITDYMTLTTKMIERQYDESLRFTRRNLQLAQARVAGLNDPVGTQNIPDYFKVVKQRDADIAANRLRQAEIPSNARRIEDRQVVSEKARQEIKDLEAKLALMGKIEVIEGKTDEDNIIVVTANKADASVAKFTKLKESIEEYDQETQDMIDTNLAAVASFEVLRESPTNFTDGLRVAAKAVAIQVNAADSMGQELINNLDGPLKALHASFKGFFSDMLSGTVSIGQAFKNMAATIIDAMIEMAAQALANQFFQLIAGAISGGITAGSTAALNSSSNNLISSNPGIFWRGGSIKGYDRGGEITSGLSTRDSTLIKAAKGEYMIRKTAVDSIGTKTLDSMNARGASALRDVGSNIVPIVPQAPQETNVYIVSPEEKPTLGPNDVLAIISNDVLKGGATKKLIKQVSNG